MTASSGTVGARGSVLTTEHSAEVREILAAHVRTTLEQAAAHEAVARELAGHTDADSIIERELAEVCAARARGVAEEAQDALARLADGTYGSCAACGGVIPVERLEVIPHARLCVVCSRPGSPGGDPAGTIRRGGKR